MKTLISISQHALRVCLFTAACVFTSQAMAQLGGGPGVGENLGFRVSPSPVDFPDTVIGSTRDASLQLAVTGFLETGGRSYTVALAGPEAGLDGVFNVASGSCPTATPLSISETCVLEATFSPADQSAYVGTIARITLTLFDEAGAPVGTTAVELRGSGTGTDPVDDILATNPPRIVIDNAQTVIDACTGDTVVDETACAELLQASPESQAAAIREIVPEKATKANVAVRQMNRVQGRLIGNRIAAVRRGADGLSIAGLDVELNDYRASVDQLADGIAAALDPLGGGASGDDELSAQLLAGSRWGVFLSGQYSTGDKDATENTSGFDFDNNVLTAGVDYRVSSNFFLGAAASLANGENDIDRDGGKLENDGLTLTLYGSWYQGERFYLDFAASVGSAEYDQTRSMRYDLFNTGGQLSGGANQLFDASYDGESMGASVLAGWKLLATQWDIDVRASLDYLESDVDSFSERARDPAGVGAGFAVNVGNQSQTWLTGTATLSTRYIFTPSWGVLVPFVDIDVIHEFENSAQRIEARFVDLSSAGPLIVRTEDPDTDYFRVRVGASVQMPGGFAASLDYGRLFAFDDWSEDTISASLRYEL